MTYLLLQGAGEGEVGIDLAKIGERSPRRLARRRLVRIRVWVFGGRGIRVLLLRGRGGGDGFGFIGVKFRVGGGDVVVLHRFEFAEKRNRLGIIRRRI